jgi:hypothetical protein
LSSWAALAVLFLVPFSSSPSAAQRLLQIRSFRTTRYDLSPRASAASSLCLPSNIFPSCSSSLSFFHFRPLPPPPPYRLFPFTCTLINGPLASLNAPTSFSAPSLPQTRLPEMVLFYTSLALGPSKPVTIYAGKDKVSFSMLHSATGGRCCCCRGARGRFFGEFDEPEEGTLTLLRPAVRK